MNISLKQLFILKLIMAFCFSIGNKTNPGVDNFIILQKSEILIQDIRSHCLLKIHNDITKNTAIESFKNKTRMTVLATCIQYRIGSSYQNIRQEKERSIQTEKEEAFLFTNDMDLISVENSQETTKNVRANK